MGYPILIFASVLFWGPIKRGIWVLRVGEPELCCSGFRVSGEPFSGLGFRL